MTFTEADDTVKVTIGETLSIEESKARLKEFLRAGHYSPVELPKENFFKSHTLAGKFEEFSRLEINDRAAWSSTREALLLYLQKADQDITSLWFENNELRKLIAAQSSRFERVTRLNMWVYTLLFVVAVIGLIRHC